MTISFTNCKKDQVENPYDLFNKPYTTGIIKFQYQVLTMISGMPFKKDTTVDFTSIGNNPSEKDDYGYSKPSIPWVQLHRLNPADFQNRAFIFFPGTDLNSLTLPFTFRSSQNGGIINRNAQINYIIGLKTYIDPSGNLIYGTDTYSAWTETGNFTLMILSRVNNRLQGTFSGDLKNQDGKIITAKNGLFDIQIVEK
jgi:hypothetical protein